MSSAMRLSQPCLQVHFHHTQHCQLCCGDHIMFIVLEQGNRGSNSPASRALQAIRAAQPLSAETYKLQEVGKCHFFLPRSSFYSCVFVWEAAKWERKHSQSSSTHPGQDSHGSSALKLCLSPPRDICWVCKRWNWCLHTARGWEQGG